MEWVNWCLSGNRCPPYSRPTLPTVFWNPYNGRIDAYRDLRTSVNDL